jgi:hypothetical protein
MGKDDDDGKYKAFATARDSKHQARIRVHYPSGNSEIYSYGDMKRIIISPPKIITLVFTGFTVTIEGKNLENDIGNLQDEKVRHVRIYDKKKYPDQPDDDTAIITKIEYSDLREQE